MDVVVGKEGLIRRMGMVDGNLGMSCAMDYWIAFGALLISVISFLWSCIVWREQKNFEGRVVKSTFVNQTRFTAEFKMYQDLMENLERTVRHVAAFTHFLTYGDYLTEKQKQYTDAHESWNALKTAVARYAPFVDKGTYDKLNKLVEDLVSQIQDMKTCTFYEEEIELKERSKHRQTIMDRGKAIKIDFDCFVCELRKTLDERENI